MSNDMVPLADRQLYLQVFRAAAGVLLLVFSALTPDATGVGFMEVLPVTGAYLGIAILAQALWRLGQGRGLWLFGGMLLADGVYLAWMTHATGGSVSLLRYVILIHIIVVTLLASFRTGLKLALWHSLLLFVVFYAEKSGAMAQNETTVRGLPGTDFERLASFVAAFWLVALGTAAFSAINERELRRRRIDLEALAGMAAELEKVNEPRPVAEVVLSSVVTAFGFERAVLLAAPEGNPVLLAQHGLLPGPPPIPGTDQIVNEMLARPQLKLLKRLHAEGNPRLTGLFPDAQNLVILPLLHEGDPFGVLIVEHSMRHGSRIEQRVVAMLSQFAAHGALALNNAWLLDRVRKMAITDGLTNIANRRSFEVALEREVSRAQRTGEQISVVMIDIDHFKKINDTYGHPAGDEVLRVTAATLANQVRNFDSLARYGGEEFAVILPASGLGDSVMVAERLRGAVANSSNIIPVTTSAGVATFPLHAATAADLVKAADEALYRSKELGRDRVTAAVSNEIARLSGLSN